MELNFLLVEHGWGHDEPGDWADPRHEEGVSVSKPLVSKKVSVSVSKSLVSKKVSVKT